MLPEIYLSDVVSQMQFTLWDVMVAIELEKAVVVIFSPINRHNTHLGE
jgi:hypothetical protein